MSAPKSSAMEKLFKSGANFKFKETDYSSSKAKAEIEEVKKLQEEIRKSAEVDLNDLKKIIFTV